MWLRVPFLVPALRFKPLLLSLVLYPIQTPLDMCRGQEFNALALSSHAVSHRHLKAFTSQYLHVPNEGRFCIGSVLHLYGMGSLCLSLPLWLEMSASGFEVSWAAHLRGLLLSPWHLLFWYLWHILGGKQQCLDWGEFQLHYCLPTFFMVFPCPVWWV